jgi:hypothetical protein
MTRVCARAWDRSIKEIPSSIASRISALARGVCDELVCLYIGDSELDAQAKDRALINGPMEIRKRAEDN